MPPIDAWPNKWKGFNPAPPSAQGVRQALNAEIVTNQRDRQSIAGLIRVIGSPGRFAANPGHYAAASDDHRWLQKYVRNGF